MEHLAGMDMQKLAEGLQRKVEAGEDVGGAEDIDFKQLAANMKAAQESEQGSKAADLAYQHIIHFLGPEKMEKFLSLDSPLDRIQFMYRQEAYLPMLQTIRKGTGSGRKGEKDALMSRQMRDAGNTAFSQGDGPGDRLALSCYNEALLAAPADPWDGQGEDMALALANRSALYARQGDTAACLKDTSLALKSGYPKHLRYKLLQRHAKCQTDLGNFGEAKRHFKEALSSLANSKLSKEQRKGVQKEIQAAIDAIQIKDGLESVLQGLSVSREDEDEEDIMEEDKDRLPSFPRNHRFPSLHQAVSVKYDSTRGRHCVASQEIPCGSVVLLEEPALSFLWGEHLLTNCSCCLAPVSSPIPCFTCCLVVFCSSECRARAWAASHQYECKALEALTSAYQNIFPAYRALAQKPLRYFLDNRSRFEKHDTHRAAGCYEYEYESDPEDEGDTDSEADSEDMSYEISAPYRATDYENLFHLVTHSDEATEGDSIALATSACLLLYYLKISNYFGSYSSRDRDGELSDSEALVARLLHHFLEVLQVNASEVCQAGPWSPEKGIKLEPIGCSVGSSLALVNHSCCPNTVLARRGATAILLTTANIKKGQEVTTTYGPVYHEKLIKSRQDHLKDRYKFSCLCPACSEKWPIYEFMTKSRVRKGVEAKALKRIQKMYSTITKLTSADLSVGHYDRVQTMWANYCGELEATLEHPNKGYVKCAGRLRDTLWLRWGSRGPRCSAPVWRDHTINQRRSSSNMNIPQMLEQEEEADQ